MTTADGLLVGFDWGHHGHTVCVLTPAGDVVTQETVAHTGEALGAWVTRLLARVGDDPARLAVAIEVPHGPVVELLLDRGIPTFSLNPKQVARFRDRAHVAGAKDDRRDARLLADALRTDRPLFRALAPEDPRIVQLRAYSRMGADLTTEARRLMNQLWATWQRYYPQLGQLAPGAADPWVWRVAELAPTPAAGARLRPAQIRAVLTSYRIRRLDAAAVLAVLRTPALVVAPGVTEAAATQARHLIDRLWLVQRQQEECAQATDALLAQLAASEDPEGPAGPNDVEILRSMPGVGPVVAARLLGEAGPALRARAYRQLRAWTGVAPVTEQSGGHRRVRMRVACHALLRDACFYWAFAALKADPACRRYYAALRARGHTLGRALRSVADRLLRILCTLLTTRARYERARFAPPTPTPTPV